MKLSAAQEKRFHQLYKEHHKMVRNVLYNMVDEMILEDLVQESFLRIWNGLPRFAFKSTLKTWIYRIALHTAVDHLRTVRLRPREVEFDDLQIVSDQELELPLNQHLIQKSLQILDEHHRSVVILHYFEELDLRQVAEILEIPLGTVKSRLFTAKSKLKVLLKKEGARHEAIR